MRPTQKKRRCKIISTSIRKIYNCKKDDKECKEEVPGGGIFDTPVSLK